MRHALRLRELLREKGLRAHTRSLVDGSVGSIAEGCLWHHDVGCLRRVVEGLNGGADGGVVRGSSRRHCGRLRVVCELGEIRRSGRGRREGVVVKERDVAGDKLDLLFVLSTRVSQNEHHVQRGRV